MRHLRLRHTLLAIGFAALFGAAPAPGQAPPAAAPARLAASGRVSIPPELERRLLEEVTVPSGFEATVFAGPPAAMYPTCLTAAPDGAVFVCIDPNLSLSVGKGWGKVVRLVDEDDDGRADRYTVFAEMDSPRGLVFDGETLFVMHPPNLSAYRDTNGDGEADRTDVLVRGLGFDLDFRGADHTTNGITMGIDGWIYVAVGDYGFQKAIGRDGTQIENRGGGVVRVRPDGTDLEVYATGTRNIYDLAIDPFLRLYTRDNTNDGDGWNTRLHYIPAGANLGYPSLYRNFSTEHFPTLFDYGAGSGTGGLWVQDPRWPEGFNNTLFTADWTVNRIFRHSLTSKGASFEVTQEDFLTVPRPADMVMDTRSNMYVASLSGGRFTYTGDTIGYVFRITPAEKTAAVPLSFTSATDAQLLETLGGANADLRLYAQREILRRGSRDATARRLEQMVLDGARPAYARVAAMFTLKQLLGPDSHPVLERAAADQAIRALALRALTDRPGELNGVPTAPFVAGLADPDPQVQAAAVTGLARLGARETAASILPLASSTDQALAHLAVNALVALGASEAALDAYDDGTPAIRAAALRVLERMHDRRTVAALVERLSRADDAAARRRLTVALARLYNKEGIWTGDWWTTRPAFAGPYFDPSPWEGSARIRPVLREAILSARGEELRSLVTDLVLNRVLPAGSEPLLGALAAGDPRREAVVNLLVGRKDVDAGAMALLMELDRRSPVLHAAVAELISAQTNVPPSGLPLLRSAVLDPALPGGLRANALTAASRIATPEGLEVASELYGRTVPAPAGSPEIEEAWRRYVGDRGRASQIDHFIGLTRSSAEGRRVLGYAVLVQLARSPRTPAPAKAQAAQAIEAAWSGQTATSLVQAIGIMGAESAYEAQLSAYKAPRASSR